MQRIIFTLLLMMASASALAAPNIVVTGGPLDFGSVSIVAGPGDDKTIVLSNNGTSNLNFTGVGYSITGADADSFQIDSTISTTAIAAGGHRNVDISFSPITPGAKTASLTITTNDADEPTVDVALTGSGANDPPVANADAYLTNEDTLLTVAAPGVLSNDTDDDGPTSALTAVLVTGPASAASFTLNDDGSFTYMPAANFHGHDAFTYKADDAFALSSAVTVSITILSVTDAPTLGSISLGATITNQNTVTVTLQSVGAVDPINFIDVSEDSSFTTKETYSYTGQTSVLHTFSAGDGLKTVYARVRNSGGSQAQSATITVDRTAPAEASGAHLAFTSGNTVAANVDLLFSVTFTEPISTQTDDDLFAGLFAEGLALTLNGDSGAASGLSVGIDSGSGAGPYVIHVTGTAPSTGDLVIGFAANRVFDAAGNALSPSSPTATVTLLTTVEGWMFL